MWAECESRAAELKEKMLIIAEAERYLQSLE